MALCAILALPAITPAQTAGDAAQRQRLAGTWEGWLMEGDGSQQSQRRQRINELVITATQISAKDGRNISMGTGSYRLGGSGALPTIDATGIMGQQVQGKTYLGIYQLQGDTLKWCSGNDKAKTRPTELKTNTGSGHLLMVLTRKK
jgi:uncharacterized protein (TIGR03067 family)